MRITLPGFGGATVPELPPPPPPVPMADDPAVVEAREKLRLAEQNRKGRGATILTGNQSQLGDSIISRPQADQLGA